MVCPPVLWYSAMVKNLPASTGDVRNASSIPGSGSLGEGNGNLLPYWVGNPIDRGAWWPTVHGASKSQT